MATPAQCAYCFETLAASFDKRKPLSLSQLEQLWDEYHNRDRVDGDDAVTSSSPPRQAAISRLINRVTPSNNSSSSTLTSTSTSTSSHQTSSSSTPADSKSSSRSSLFSTRASSSQTADDAYPLFVTWNTVSGSGNKSLRGCIGTFAPQPLDDGLRTYALDSAFDDHRFPPIPKDLLPRLQCCVTLLTDFSTPTKDPMDWTIGVHGIRISFTYHGRRLGATYLPDVALEQGWTKEEAIISLMRKAGWSGNKQDWRKVTGLELVRYEGKKVDLLYKEFKEFRDWVDKRG